MKQLLQWQVRFWIMVVVMVCTTLLGVAGGTLLARDTIYDYTLSVAASDAQGEPVALQYGAWPELSNIDFFRTIRDGFVHEKANFIEANLTSMSMTVYREGTAVLTVPIKSKGKEGSWWETPSGLYRAQAKEETHYSSFGHVYMPWSIPFQGNFFIHGWPYAADGTPVPEGYSGGCMRLEDQYAKQVYDLTDVGMPILVFEESQLAGETKPYTLNVPDIHAQSYLVADLESNFVLLSGGAGTQHDTRVVSTLMAVMVASEYQNIEKAITAKEDVLDPGDVSGIEIGKSYSLYDLFFPLVMQSSPSAFGVIASHFGTERFTDLLQTKAEALGMQDTVFSGSGYALRESTTPEEVFLMLKYLHANRPFVLDMSAGKTNVATYGAPALYATSTHPFFEDDRFVGGSFDIARMRSSEGTEALVALVFASSSASSLHGYSDDVVVVYSLQFGGAKRTVAFIVLDTDDIVGDVTRMRSHVSTMYR